MSHSPTPMRLFGHLSVEPRHRTVLCPRVQMCKFCKAAKRPSAPLPRALYLGILVYLSSFISSHLFVILSHSSPHSFTLSAPRFCAACSIPFFQSANAIVDTVGSSAQLFPSFPLCPYSFIFDSRAALISSSHAQLFSCDEASVHSVAAGHARYFPHFPNLPTKATRIDSTNHGRSAGNATLIICLAWDSCLKVEGTWT
jgi:hypothetical protein